MSELQCIRCKEAPAADENGYCGHCHWAVRSEVSAGLYKLRELLQRYAAFNSWCVDHGIEPGSY